MSAQGLEVIDRTVQSTHEWINELAERVEWRDRRHTLLLLRSTLTSLRDMLDHDEAAHLSAQLPILIRGFYFEGWRPSTTPLADRSKEGFVRRVAERFKGSPAFAGEKNIREVFRLLNNRISEGEVGDVRAALPTALRSLWPD